MTTTTRMIGLALLAGLGLPEPARAQPAPDPGPEMEFRATRVAEAPRIDGVLDEAFWSELPAFSGFLQREPVDGAPASEGTEVRIAYDDDALYFGLVMTDSEPGAIRRSILHREGRIDQDDRVIIALDTYRDRRNAYIFELNPFGTQGDALISDESMTLADWNWEGVYRSEGRITDEGWVLEVAIPFTTIRFSAEDAPEMGLAFYRSIRRKNEDVFLPHIGQRFRSGISQVSRYGTLTGLEGLRRGRYLELKPFAIAGAQRFGGADETTVLDDVGLDVKYALTSNVTLDLTLNTDFAQVEADNVQINLTRFALRFPEKREFFLERAGLFGFGDTGETELFFSRRIGLTTDIIGGGRVTGQAGPLSYGALSLQTGSATVEGAPDLPSANNAVARMRADVLPRTTVGAIVTNLQGSGFHDRGLGTDLSARFWGSSTFDAWVAGVDASDREGWATAGAAELNLRNDRFGVDVGYTGIGTEFDPALGFVRRADMRRWSGGASWFPRFETSPWARRLVTALQGHRIHGQDGDLQSWRGLWHNMLTLQTGDWLVGNLEHRFERLDGPSAIQGRPLSAGDYGFTAASVSFRTNESRPFSGRGEVVAGEFWNGTRTGLEGGLTWKTGPHLTLTGAAQHNRIDLPVEDGRFETTVLALDVLGAVSRKLFANALLQWDDVSRVLQANIRIDWIHTPGSDLFVVLDTGYFTGDTGLDPRATRWDRRTGVVKLTYLKAF